MDWQWYFSTGLLVVTIVVIAPVCWFTIRNDGDLSRRLLDWQEDHRLIGFSIFVAVSALATGTALAARTLMRDESSMLQIAGVVLDVISHASVVSIMWVIYSRIRKLPAPRKRSASPVSRGF